MGPIDLMLKQCAMPARTRLPALLLAGVGLHRRYQSWRYMHAQHGLLTGGLRRHRLLRASAGAHVSSKRS